MLTRPRPLTLLLAIPLAGPACSPARPEGLDDDFPDGRNSADGCDPPCEMDGNMNGPDEPHCPDLSHHCNTMRREFSHIGIGYYPPEGGTWNTRNSF